MYSLKKIYCLKSMKENGKEFHSMKKNVGMLREFDSFTFSLKKFLIMASKIVKVLFKKELH